MQNKIRKINKRQGPNKKGGRGAGGVRQKIQKLSGGTIVWNWRVTFYNDGTNLSLHFACIGYSLGNKSFECFLIKRNSGTCIMLNSWSPLFSI